LSDRISGAEGVNLSAIPLSAIERVEVLLDGASAIYGSDAIGGVINFIMKHDYQGLEVTAFTDVTQLVGHIVNRRYVAHAWTARRGSRQGQL